VESKEKQQRLRSGNLEIGRFSSIQIEIFYLLQCLIYFPAKVFVFSEKLLQIISETEGEWLCGVAISRLCKLGSEVTRSSLNASRIFQRCFVSSLNRIFSINLINLDTSAIC
jgi:hypothetical protein